MPILAFDMPTFRGRRVNRPTSGNTYTPKEPFSSEKWDNEDYEFPDATTQEITQNDAIRQNHRLDKSVSDPNYDARYYGLMGYPTAMYPPRSGWFDSQG